MMTAKIIAAVVLLLCSGRMIKGQDISLRLNDNKKFRYDLMSDKLSKDTIIDLTRKKKVQKVNIGGLFVAPNVGISFPLGKFGNYSNSGLMYGVKFELAYSRLYPFIFGFVYESQKNKGNADFTTTNFLNKFDTKIISLGGSLDIILNKYIKSDFTIPVFSIEVKFAKVTREIVPAISIPDISTEESLLTYSAGLGFTIYIFDLGARYTYGKNFNNLTFQAKLHLPIIKF